MYRVHLLDNPLRILMQLRGLIFQHRVANFKVTEVTWRLTETGAQLMCMATPGLAALSRLSKNAAQIDEIQSIGVMQV